MKVIVLLFCAVAGASAGNAVAWPGAIPLTAAVNTIIPPQIKAFGYSTSEYINAVPAAAIRYQPQFNYQFAVPSYQHLQPVVSASYYPSNNIFYPSFAPAAPVAPVSPVFPINTISSVSPIIPVQPPQQNLPSATPEQPAGDEDSAVIESADSLPNQQEPSQQQPSQPSLDSKNMPAVSQIPQAPQQFPFFPQFPPFVQQGFPSQQFEIQQNPSLPQAPSPSPSFPAADSSDNGQNDEDSVAVDSA